MNVGPGDLVKGGKKRGWGEDISRAEQGGVRHKQGGAGMEGHTQGRAGVGGAKGGQGKGRGWGTSRIGQGRAGQDMVSDCS